LNHNVETVPRLYAKVRAGARYERSLGLLRRARELRPRIPTKSGLMVGLGETREELFAVLRDLRAAGCDLVTIGQYLRPTRNHLPVQCYYAPQEFAELRRAGLAFGLRHVEAGPLVRSSYHAREQSEAAVRYL
jgi:lipoic acid synthetase